MYKMLIVEDDVDIRTSLLRHFETSEKISCIFSTNSVERLLKFNSGIQKVDIILLDINLPNKSGVDALPSIRRKYPDSEIIMYTIVDDNDKIFKALCLGASGYLIKNQTPKVLEQQLLEALESGGSPISPMIARRIIRHFNPYPSVPTPAQSLTKNERKVMLLLKEGLKYVEIAEELDITIHGVRFHVANIYKKLQVNTRHQAIMKFDEGID